jgi:hypothetical protein
MADDTPKTEFARFLSCVPGAIVARYGTMTQKRANQQIGVTHDGKGRPVWHPEIIVALTEHEARAYKREYDRAVKGGALVERTEEEYLAFVNAGTKKAEAPRPRKSSKGKSTKS